MFRLGLMSLTLASTGFDEAFHPEEWETWEKAFVMCFGLVMALAIGPFFGGLQSFRDHDPKTGLDYWTEGPLPKQKKTVSIIKVTLLILVLVPSLLIAQSIGKKVIAITATMISILVMYRNTSIKGWLILCLEAIIKPKPIKVISCLLFGLFLCLTVLRITSENLPKFALWLSEILLQFKINLGILSLPLSIANLSKFETIETIPFTMWILAPFFTIHLAVLSGRRVAYWPCHVMSSAIVYIGIFLTFFPFDEDLRTAYEDIVSNLNL